MNELTIKSKQSKESQKSVVQTTAYKQTEVGLIPSDWEVTKLGMIANIFGGGTPSSFVNSYWNGDVNWFTPTEIGKEKYSYQSIRKISNLGFENCSAKMLPVGTILLTTRAGIGDVSILMKEGCTNQGFQSFVVKNEIDNEYVYYLISTLKNVFLQNASGSTFLEISPNKIRAIQIPLPPTLTEQTAIATALSDADALISSLEKLILKKRNIKQGAMQKLLQPNPESHREGWEVNKLGEIVNIRKGQIITESTTVLGSIPVIAGGKSPAYFHNKANCLGKTITISGSGASAGYVAFHDYPIFASDCSTIEEHKDYSIEYVFYLMQLLQDKIYKMQTGGAQPHIHPSDLNPIEVSFPKKEKQEQIATILSDMDAEISALETKLEKCKKVKLGMMQNLLTGKIRLI